MTLTEVYKEISKSLMACRARMVEICRSPSSAPTRYAQELEHERDLLGRLERLAGVVVEPAPENPQKEGQGPSNWERLVQRPPNDESESEPET
jgi:hypothetical protein